MTSICHFAKPILMLIYYSFFDAIKAIYGKFIQTKERKKGEKEHTVQNTPFIIAHELVMYIFIIIILCMVFHGVFLQYYTSDTIQHNKCYTPMDIHFIPQTVELHKVIVSIAFDSKINKTICRTLTTVNNSIGCLHRIALHCIALNHFAFMIQSKWNLIEAIQRGSSNAFACTTFIRKIATNT